MATQNVTYRVNSLLSCALCLPADVILCLASDDIVIPPVCPDTEEPQPYPRSTLAAQVTAVTKVNGGSSFTTYYDYTIEYDDELITPELLLTEDILSVVCDGCLKTYIDEAVGNEPFFTDNGDGTTTYTSAHGCETTFEAAVVIPDAWRLTGNAATVLGTNFIGTTDNVGFDIRVNNLRAVRITPANGATASPNIVGGYSGNLVGAFAEGTFIGSGGSAAFINSIPAGRWSSIVGGSANIIQAVSAPALDHNFIGGGRSNTVTDGNYTSIVGGNGNLTDGHYDFIGGGENNDFTGRAFWTSIVGGKNNVINGANYSAIVGGYNNVILGTDIYSIIGAGNSNSVSSGLESGVFAGNSNQISSGDKCFIGSGYGNAVFDARYSAAVAGYQCQVEGTYQFLGGGYQNNCQYSSLTQGEMVLCGGSLNQVLGRFGALVGGSVNTINSNSVFGFIGGGQVNVVGSSSNFGFIGCGHDNTVGNSTQDAAIVCGADNTIGTSSYRAFIGGGDNNSILTNTLQCSIVGGAYNEIQANAIGSVIVGGNQLTIGSRSFGFNNEAGLTGTVVSAFSGIAFFGNVDVWIANTDEVPKKLKLFEAYGGSNFASATYHSLEAPEAGFSDDHIEYILPIAIGTVGQSLQIDTLTPSVGKVRVQLIWA